jgi:hypothetical protein
MLACCRSKSRYRASRNRCSTRRQATAPTKFDSPATGEKWSGDGPCLRTLAGKRLNHAANEPLTLQPWRLADAAEISGPGSEVREIVRAHLACRRDPAWPHFQPGGTFPGADYRLRRCLYIERVRHGRSPVASNAQCLQYRQGYAPVWIPRAKVLLALRWDAPQCGLC